MKTLEIEIKAIKHPTNSNVTFEGDVKKAVNKIAAERGVSQSQVVNALLRKAMCDEGNASRPANRSR